MNCIVTAGPTYEPLDRVRRLTNLSTGKLGVELANHLAAKGHRVTLLKGYYSVYPGVVRAAETISFTTTDDLSERLRALAAPSVTAFFHAAAVSDFRFGKAYVRSPSGGLTEVRAGKLPTSGEPMLVELVPTPKIIASLRAWFGTARLVGWKYEVDGGQQNALSAGAEQICRCQTDACVVNGPAYGDGFGVVRPDGRHVHLADAAALFEFLEQLAAAR